MLKIGICTNRAGFEQYTENVLRSILCEFEDWIMEAIPVSTLLEKKKSELLGYHVFCMDEQLLEQGGIEAVSFVSRANPDATILLLEGQEEKGIAGVRYHLFAYQLQRIKQRNLREELSRQWNRANTATHNLDIVMDGERISIPIERIVYIESNNHRIVLHTTMGDYEYYEKMYVIENLLKDNEFIRCHQSYMVSKQFVTNYNSMEIQLDEIVIPIGRKYKQQVYDAFGLRNDLVADEKEYKTTEKQGVLICERGTYKGVVLHFRPEQSILVGRDEKVADIVVNLPKVSRLHCVIVFHEQDNTYEIIDFSKNGTYISEQQRLVSDISYSVKPGTRISFGDSDNMYCLG